MLAKKTIPAIIKSFPQMGMAGIFLFNLFMVLRKSVSGTFTSRSLSIKKERSSGYSSGQVVLEYVLLMVVALTISIVLLRNLVGTADEPAGFRKAWIDLLQTIAADKPN